MADSPKPLILGIHGLANKPPRAELERGWRRALREGLRKNFGRDRAVEFRLVYWADLLYRQPLHTEPAFAFDALFNTEPYAPARRGALRRYDDAWTDRARHLASRALGAGIDLLEGALGFDRLGNAFLRRRLRDLAFYYDAQRTIADREGRLRPARDVLRQELAAAVRAAAGRRLMLVAHSMGSIIAYDVLRDLEEEENAPPFECFATIGSPLGFPYVKGRLLAERGPALPLRTPALVRRAWLNFADRADPVALDAHLADDFASNDRGVRVRDILVCNDYAAPGGGARNPHKAYGYLRTPEMSEAVAAFL